jgi:hypothetical protein
MAEQNKHQMDVMLKEETLEGVSSDFRSKEDEVKKKRPTHQKALLVVPKDELIYDVMELRKEGLTYRQILSTLVQKHGNQLSNGFSLFEVRKLFSLGMIQSKQRFMETGSEIIQLEYDRLEALWQAYYPLAMDGNIKAGNICIKIMGRRARMMGLDKPQTVNIKDWRTEIIELVKQGKVSLADVRKQIPESLYGEIDGLIVDGSSVEYENGGDEGGVFEEEEDSISGEDDKEP